MRRLVWRLIGAAVSLLLAAWLVSLGAVLLWARRDDAAGRRVRGADAIVVMGAAQYVGRPSPVLRARLDHAIDLWRGRVAPQLIVTGGTGLGDTTSEAEVGRRYAVKAGVPAGAIAVEGKGRTTRESVDGVAAIMRGDSAPTVVLVSDPFHMLRLVLLARRAGLRVYTSPTRTSPISSSAAEWKYVLSESVKAPIAYLFERRTSQ